jgi:hypothetical protein
MPSFTSGGNLAPPYGEAWWWQHHAVGMFLSGRDWKTSQEMNLAKYREILDDNLLQSSQVLRLRRWFTFQQDNNPKHTAKTMQEWLRECP